MAALGATAPIGGRRDPALLAFIKCHLTSTARWNALRMLALSPDRWWTADDVARAIHEPPISVSVVLEDLAAEAVIQHACGPASTAYRLDGADPTGRVIARLVDEARRNEQLRQVIVSRILAAPGRRVRA